MRSKSIISLSFPWDVFKRYVSSLFPFFLLICAEPENPSQSYCILRAEYIFEEGVKGFQGKPLSNSETLESVCSRDHLSSTMSSVHALHLCEREARKWDRIGCEERCERQVGAPSRGGL